MSEPLRDVPFNCCRVIKVIETTLGHAGKGIETEPHRRLRQYWTLDGILLATVDEWKDRQEARGAHAAP